MPSAALTLSNSTRFKHNLLFLRKFLRHRLTIASVWPSSRAMARATLREIAFDRAQIIVELGAGTGPVTQAIVDHLHPHTRFLAIERDPDFAAILKQRFHGRPNVEIIHTTSRTSPRF